MKKSRSPVEKPSTTRPRRFAPREVIAAAAEGAPRIDLQRLRSDIDLLVDQVTQDALGSLGVDLLLLFGSRARGTSGPNSDFDIGVLFAPRKPKGVSEIENVRQALGGGDHLDLVCLNTADPLLLRLAAEEGVPHFESYPGALEEFRLRAHKRYMDTAKFRKLEADSLKSLYG